MAERLKAPDSKSGRGVNLLVGSNPTLSANLETGIMMAKQGKFYEKIIILFLLFASMLSCSQKKFITLYFSEYTDTDAYLSPVKRSVIRDNLYKIALEELIKGPKNHSEGNAVLPKTTKILSVEKNDNLLIVNFSKEIILDANQIRGSSKAEHFLSIAIEELALGSIANTLTEFPEIEAVRVLIEGKNQGEINGREIADFWGHSNIRDNLTRSEGLIRK